MSQFHRACRDFAITYLTTAFVIVVVAWQLAAADIAITAFAGMVPVVLTGCMAGIRYRERTGRRPETGLSWAFALCGTAMVAIFATCITMTMLITMHPETRTAIEALVFQPAFISMALAVTLTVHVLALRYCFQAGGGCSIRLAFRRSASA